MIAVMLATWAILVMASGLFLIHAASWVTER